MFAIPTVLTSQEIIDKAFKKASRVTVSDPDFRFRMEKLNTAKVDSVTSVIDSTLEGYVKAFPGFDRLPPFYIALIDLMHPIDEIRRALGRMDGARREIVLIGSKTNRQIRRTAKTSYMDQKRNEAFGRISSLVGSLDGDLRFLARVREDFKRLPSIPTKYPTAVIAGYPNVGKSQLIARLSTAKPEVAPYPFTTQELVVGYFERNRAKYQIVDTPGLLDRPFEDRNQIEKKAVLALTLLTDLCIFIIDPTGHCGYSLEPQLNLFSSIARTARGMRFIVCINKIDLPLPEGVSIEEVDKAVQGHEDRVLEYLTISGETGDGVDEVVDAIVANLSVEEKAPWEDPSFDTGRPERGPNTRDAG
jgi:nucleolar GTP-binding protein